MPLGCEIGLTAYCRPNDVVRRPLTHAPNRKSPNVTTSPQYGPYYTALPPR
jgi:hypothetical protein